MIRKDVKIVRNETGNYQATANVFYALLDHIQLRRKVDANLKCL